MVFLGDGTPEGNDRAKLLNQRSIGPNEQVRAAFLDFYRNLEHTARIEFRRYLRLRKKVEFGMSFAGLRQSIDMSIVNRPENSAVMRAGRKSLPTLSQMLAVVNEIDPLD